MEKEFLLEAIARNLGYRLVGSEDDRCRLIENRKQIIDRIPGADGQKKEFLLLKQRPIIVKGEDISMILFRDHPEISVLLSDIGSLRELLRVQQEKAKHIDLDVDEDPSYSMRGGGVIVMGTRIDPHSGRSVRMMRLVR